MKAFRIQNDIVAAETAQEAIAAWAEDRNELVASAGPVEEIDPTQVPCTAESHEGDGSIDPEVKTIADIMPSGGPACVVAYGNCEDCP